MASPPAELSDNLCWLLMRTGQALTGELAREMHDLGFPARTHQVLAAAAGGEHTQIELARMVGLDKTTMVATIDQAEKLGLAERKPAPNDRRVRVVAVTDEGRRKLADADVIIHRVHEEWLASLPKSHRDRLVADLQALVTDRT